jgi:hypothetical protein
LQYYKKAEAELTISEELQLRQQVEKLRIENADIPFLKSNVYKQSEDLAFMRSVLERYAKQEAKPPMSQDEEKKYLAWLAETRESELAKGS